MLTSFIMRKESSKDKAVTESPAGSSKQEDPRKKGTLRITQSMEEACTTQQSMIINLLGSGSYGEVYLCQNSMKGRPPKIALKVIDIEKANKIYVEKFLKRELLILTDLKFKFIIHIYCIFQRRNKYYFFMRYAEEGDLLDYIVREGRVDEPLARLWAGQLAAAIEFLHKNNIAHRDIKCENVLLTKFLNTMLTDFGFSRKYDRKEGKPSLCTTYCGTKHYASPEILTYTPYDPEKSDVWAFGVVLYFMLNGTVPFRETVTKKILECQQKGVKMRPGVAANEDLMIIVKNVFEINPMKRWTAKRLVMAPWFKSGPANCFSAVHHNAEFHKMGDLPQTNSPTSFISCGALLPSFMDRSQDSDGLKQRLAEYKKKREEKKKKH